jgi:uncharacterized protein (DUF427 family)
MTELFFSYGHPATEELPEHFVRMEPTPQRIRAVLDGVALADSQRVLIMHESGRAPAYYFPMDDVRMDLMESTTNATT